LLVMLEYINDAQSYKHKKYILVYTMFCIVCTVFVLFYLCTFILICFVCTGVRITATE
jgi:hypothetical protein